MIFCLYLLKCLAEDRGGGRNGDHEHVEDRNLGAGGGVSPAPGRSAENPENHEKLEKLDHAVDDQPRKQRKPNP